MQKYLGRYGDKKILIFLIKMVLLFATESIIAILVFTCPFREKMHLLKKKSINEKFKKKK